MNIVALAIRQPITVTVGMILAVLAGAVALLHVPVQMTPTVDDTVIGVTTRWENASPQEVEAEVVDPQEEKLQGIANLRSMTSTSTRGEGQIRLEFHTGVDKEAALREVSDKLREVPEYPANVKEPEVQASDPESHDYIAWILLKTPDPDLDIRTLQDFVEDRVKPQLERVPGLSEVNVLGGREGEAQIRFDPVLMAQHGVTIPAFIEALRATNRNMSAGALDQGKYDVRIRTVNRFDSPRRVLETVIRQDEAGPVYVRDVAEVVETYKEETGFVRHMGRRVLALNFQREPGTNLMQVMDSLKEAVARINDPGAVLDTYATANGIEGGLKLVQVYDQTIYVDQAFSLVRGNLVFGGLLAIVILMVFLRSLVSIGIIAVSIPISVIGSVVVMVAMGRSINVVSLAGMAFAVGMVVDNAIVVLENIYRHLEQGKPRKQAALDGAREVMGAVLASTLTTMFVFIPILLVQEMSGQLLRDIALAIVTAVGLSFIVSVTVIPSGAGLFLGRSARQAQEGRRRGLAGWLFSLTHWLNGGMVRRVVLIGVFAVGTFWGIVATLPPIDYLPAGNRNLTFGMMIPPPGYSVDQMRRMGERVEAKIRPFWMIDGPPDPEGLYEVPTGFTPDAPRVTPPALSNYFLVAAGGSMLFHGGISADEERAVDLVPLFQMATGQDTLPGTFAFAFQFPLFRLGGSSGGAVKIDLVGADLDRVTSGTLALFGTLAGEYGPYAVRPNPSNFNVPAPEIQIDPDQDRLSDLGMTVADLGLAVQGNSDGIIIGDYRQGGRTIDLKVISRHASGDSGAAALAGAKTAAPNGDVVSLGSLAGFHQANAPEQIKRVNRQRAVTLEFTPPKGMPLQEAINSIETRVDGLKSAGVIAPGVEVVLAGSASRLNEVKTALLGDGTFLGTVTSALFLALLVVYLLMCVLFQSWLYPLVIMVSVPMATLGGFLGLSAVNAWSSADRYLPVQNMDVLTMLGLIILAGVVVNNAILIVSQTLNFAAEGKNYREAISLSVESRVRPIFMGTLTSVGGMTPLVLMPGAGSELYRGLGSVVVGGLIVSTVFTLILVPTILGLVHDIKQGMSRRFGRNPTAAMLILMIPCLAGCAVGPDYERQDPETPAAWTEPAFEGIPEGLDTWWTLLGDDELDRLIARAVSGSPDLKIAAERVLEARARRGLRNADLFPKVDLGASSRKTRSSENIDRTIRNDFIQSDYRTKSISVHSAGIDAAWELDLFGGLRRSVEAAGAEIEAAGADHADALVSLLAETVLDYIELRSSQERLAIARSVVETRRRELALVTARHQAGLAESGELAVARREHEAAQAGIPDLEKSITSVINRLTATVGAMPGELDHLRRVSPVPTVPRHLGAGVPAEILRRRPDVRGAERRLAFETARIGIAEAELYPKFFLNGSFNFSASETGDLFHWGSRTYDFGPSFSWRIFSYKSADNAIRAQQSRRRQASIAFHQTVLEALVEVENAMSSCQAERKSLAALDRAAGRAREAVRAERSRFDSGLAGLEPVLRAERELLRLRDEESLGRARLASSVVLLYKALGGGWPDGE